MCRKRPPISIQNSAVSFSPARKASSDLLHLVHARRRVAVLHLAADHTRRAREHALALAVEAHAVVLVYVAEVDGQRREHEVELLQREPAGLSSRSPSDGRACRAGACAVSPDPAGGQGAGTAREQSVADLAFAGAHRRPLGVVQRLQRHGEEELLLLGHHVVGRLGELLGAARRRRRRRPAATAASVSFRALRSRRAAPT